MSTCLADQQLTLQPVLATGWTPSSAANVSTFDIRQGLRSTTADRSSPTTWCTPTTTGRPEELGERAVGVRGVLSPSGVTKVDDYTVAFHLEGPNREFPYLTSSENNNMIILPDGYDPADWQSSFIGTGPFVLKSTRRGRRVVHPQQAVLGIRPCLLPPSSLYDTQAPQILALSGGALDVIGRFSVSGASSCSPRCPYNIVRLRSSAHEDCRCGVTPRRHRPPGAPGDRAHPEPASDRSRIVPGLR